MLFRSDFWQPYAADSGALLPFERRFRTVLRLAVPSVRHSVRHLGPYDGAYGEQGDLGVVCVMNRKKMIAPVVVTAAVILYYAVYFGFLINLFDGVWKVVLAIVPLAFAAVMIKVCIERINEIRKGEEDDLGQY